MQTTASPVATRTRPFKHVFLFGGLCLLLLPIFVQSLALITTSWTFFSFTGHLILSSLAGTGLACTAYLAHGCINSRFTDAEEADWALLFLAFVVPIVLLLTRFNPLPTSDDNKVNCLVTFAFLLRLGSLMDLPPAHSLAQTVVSYPIFT